MIIINKIRRRRRIKSPKSRIQAVVDNFSPKVTKKFFIAFQNIRKELTLNEIADLLENNPNAILSLLNIESRLAEELIGEQGVSPLLRDTFKEGHIPGLKALPEKIAVRIRFDLLNPRSIDFLTKHQFGLVRSITNTTKNVIQRAILEGFSLGLPPKAQAKIIVDSIGLTEKQFRAVTNFRRQLEQKTLNPIDQFGNVSSPQNPLNRKLSQRERLKAISQIKQGNLSQKQIDELVNSYQKRLTLLRAETISRTETMRAAQAGQDELWKQAADQGLINVERARKFWLVTDDDRLRETHREIPRMNEGGVGLNEPFSTPFGLVDGPPAEPNCRCDVIIETGT